MTITGRGFVAVDGVDAIESTPTGKNFAIWSKLGDVLEIDNDTDEKPRFLA